jgi:hypothetical protein
MIATRFRVGVTRLNGPANGIHQIIVHFGGPLAVARVVERLAEAGRAAIVDLKHGVAAVGKPLHGRD